MVSILFLEPGTLWYDIVIYAYWSNHILIKVFRAANAAANGLGSIGEAFLSGA